MNIDVRTQAQETINDGATQDLLSATTRRLTQQQLCHLILSGYRCSKYEYLHTVYVEVGAVYAPFMSYRLHSHQKLVGWFACL